MESAHVIREHGPSSVGLEIDVVDEESSTATQDAERLLDITPAIDFIQVPQHVRSEHDVKRLRLEFAQVPSAQKDETHIAYAVQSLKRVSEHIPGDVGTRPALAVWGEFASHAANSAADLEHFVTPRNPGKL
jgi:hypothetical protein